MSRVARITGDYTLTATGDVNIGATVVRIGGDLIVTGTTSTVNTTDTTLADNIITLNDGELGAGVSLGFAGIEVDRGTDPTVGLRWNETTDQWEITSNGSTWSSITTGAATFDLVNDLTPQLGGDLDMNGFDIVSLSNADIVLDPDGTGVVIATPLALDESAPEPAVKTGYNVVYAVSGDTPGGSGIHFKNDQTEDELISKSKAIVYSLIF